ncbi:hypothetical protein [Streptomyces sp. NPDC059378]|uniref:hypothetical protein n=1 Tax=Streptomyces sp. NPDC059378 TaxID=3346815 RepID=UPI0036B5A2ED
MGERKRGTTADSTAVPSGCRASALLCLRASALLCRRAAAPPRRRAVGPPNPPNPLYPP